MIPERIRLRVLHTNDIHSHFEQLPRIASIIGRLREEAGAEHTLSLDIGDHIDRMRPETEGTGGLANIALLNAIGYDAVTLGNNEGLTCSADVLNDLYGKHVQSKVVLANLRDAATGCLPSWASPYTIICKSGVQIGLIGVTACFPDFYGLLGWEVSDPFEAIASLAADLRPKVDVLIVMSHLGLSNDERMAVEIPGIDLILGGHTHHLLEEPIRSGRTLICAAGKFGQYVGVVDLELDALSKRLLQAEGAVRPVAGSEEEETIRLQIEEFAVMAKASLDREVGRLDYELAVDWYGESRLGNLLAAGLRDWVGAEIGLVNAGVLLGGLPKGLVSAGTLLELCPSPINPCRMMLSGAHLLKALEESLLPEFMDKPLHGFGFRGKVLGTLCVDGMTIEYDPEAQPYSRILSVRVGTEALELDRLYTVGTIDMFTFRRGYLSIAEGLEPQFFLPEFLRDVLLKELHDARAMKDSARKRWVRMYG
ncbi:5'-nucleotidase [Paenibacillus sp. PvR052]|nr:2',3'-cyclic-nucleotide 2'-phosphodiesterase (5'-nucleotidase family) [Paenibacillus sp. PvP091]MBP1170050.1 2',3'-cyclic-nucleotide 2'-phosphodiesterase (5'-nucleotidase family) [Paenibacillus sp. PvR098]MBP2441078.1 2',3'-cyclic-nucleotide 2'-phosphodiesterase (5'-nucleotidase family) [Paenibacillus sp. PvP052]